MGRQGPSKRILEISVTVWVSPKFCVSKTILVCYCILATLKKGQNTLKLPHSILKTTLAQPFKRKHEIMMKTFF